MRRKMKRITAGLLSMSMVFAAVGCGGGNAPESSGTSDERAEQEPDTRAGEQVAEGEAASSGETADLMIWLAGSGDATNDEAYRAIFDKWIEENAPGSTYELSFVGWGEYATKLSVALASGEGPDLFMSGYGMFGSFQAQDYMLNLSEYIPHDWDGYTDIGENFLDAGKVDGDIYGILEPATRLLMYRKDIAEQNGVTEEELQVDSLDDLENLAKKMCVTDDAGNLAMSGLELMSTAVGPNDPAQIYSLVARNIDFDNAGLWDAEGKAVFAGDCGIRTFEYLKKLYEAGVSLPSESGDNTSGIVSGLASMCITAESGYGSADAAFPGQIGIVPCSLNTLLIGNFMCVNAGTAYKEQAVDLLLYMFNEESCKKKAEALGAYSLRDSLKDWYIETFPHMAVVPEYYSNSYAFGPTAIPYYNEGITIFRNASEQIMAANADIAATLTDAAAQWDALKTN